MTMQLAFYKAPGTWADKAIRVFTGSKYSHVELVIGTECWSASARDGFVRAKTMWLDPDKWDVIDIHGAEPFALAWFTQHAGQRYDWAGVARFVLPLLPNSRNRWFCSEAVAAALAQPEPDLWTPQMLFERYTTQQ